MTLYNAKNADIVIDKSGEIIAEWNGTAWDVIPRWFWVSFAEGDTFHGGCFLEAASHLDAWMQSKILDCNPGGDVLIVEVDDPDSAPVNLAEIKGRLLSREEMTALGLGPRRYTGND